MSSFDDRHVRTKRHVLGQLVICKGCCCGRPDKGRPGLPEERLKTAWKTERLGRTIQLTISGCVGPCDVANVVQIVTPSGIEWYGSIDEDSYYDELVEWARACRAENALLPRPSRLVSLQFNGYIVEDYTVGDRSAAL
jgi:(2Fe-2S) ferredoxin